MTAVAVAGAMKQGPASSAACPAVVAAAEAILPKRRLVTVNNPVKLQAIRLLGILGVQEWHAVIGFTLVTGWAGVQQLVAAVMSAQQSSRQTKEHALGMIISPVKAPVFVSGRSNWSSC